MKIEQKTPLQLNLKNDANLYLVSFTLFAEANARDYEYKL